MATDRSLPLLSADQLRVLGFDRQRCERLEAELASARAIRDRRALELIDAGYKWRDVARAAGFANPYIAELRRKRRRGLV